MIRRCCIVALFGIAGVLVLCSPSPTQTGKQTDLNKANQLIGKLQAQIQSMKADAQKTTGGKTAAQLKKDLDKANKTIQDKDQLIATLQNKSPTALADLAKENEALRKTIRQLERLKKAPYVHAVILKMKKDDDEQIRIVMAEAAKTLAKIDGVRGIWIGTPADNNAMETKEKDFQVGLVVLLDDAEALQKFRDDPLQRQFSEKISDSWRLPAVYDIHRDGDNPKKAP